MESSRGARPETKTKTDVEDGVESRSTAERAHTHNVIKISQHAPQALSAAEHNATRSSKFEKLLQNNLLQKEMIIFYVLRDKNKAIS
jgi:hypothetical protein